MNSARFLPALGLLAAIAAPAAKADIWGHVTIAYYGESGNLVANGDQAGETSHLITYVPTFGCNALGTFLDVAERWAKIAEQLNDGGISAIAGAYNAYEEIQNFNGSAGDRTVQGAVPFAVYIPNPAWTDAVVTFHVYSDNDAFLRPTFGPRNTPGVTPGDILIDEDDGSTDPDGHAHAHSAYLRVRLNFAALRDAARAAGGDLYSGSLPLVFGAKEDAYVCSCAIIHQVNLSFQRPVEAAPRLAATAEYQRDEAPGGTFPVDTLSSISAILPGTAILTGDSGDDPATVNVNFNDGRFWVNGWPCDTLILRVIAKDDRVADPGRPLFLMPLPAWTGPEAPSVPIVLEDRIAWNQDGDQPYAQWAAGTPYTRQGSAAVEVRMRVSDIPIGTTTLNVFVSSDEGWWLTRTVNVTRFLRMVPLPPTPADTWTYTSDN